MRRHRSRAALSRQQLLGTIAAYGPDNTLATKLVAGVLERSGQGEPLAIRTWTTTLVDVRHDPTISAEVAVFLREHGATETATNDRIIGCPHEEGVDYPIGRTCPRCPFWAGIDRFTHEPIAIPAPTMSPPEILTALAETASVELEEALDSADGHREMLVEPLLAALDRGMLDPEGASTEEANLFSYALYLLAKWRDARAYTYVVRWLSLPDEQPFAIGGDIVTEDGPRILAAVCDGDLEPIKALILNREADEYSRSAGVTALALLAAWAEVPREPIVEYFVWLARRGLEREPSVVWNSLAWDAARIDALEVLPELRLAYDEGLIDPQSVAPEDLEEAQSAPRRRLIEALQAELLPIDDVAVETSWWSDGSASDDRDDEGVAWVEPQEPYRAPPKIGRNEPCPCGSGKKFKKCCGA